jgi:predicted SprT family Zn-dependent metalloprotease
MTDFLKIVKEYVQATEDYNQRVDKISEAFGEDNSILTLVPDSFWNNRDNLLKEVIGSNNFDWLMWFMYDRNKHETESPNVYIGEDEYFINVLEHLVEICFDNPTAISKG